MITDETLLTLGIDEDYATATCRHISVLTVQEHPVPTWMCMACGAITAACFDIADQMFVHELIDALT